MRAFALTVVLCLVGLSTSTSALAQETITVSTWGSPNHGINTIVWPTWKKWIEEATDNRVTLEVVYDLGPPQAQMELVADGVGDASWIFHGHMPGRFTLTQLPEFPVFEEFSSEIASAAYWRAHERFLASTEEHRGVVVMGVGVHGPGQLFAAGRPSALADMSDKRVRVGGGVMGDVATRVGVRGAAIPPTETYEALAQGVVEGAFFTPEALRSFRIAEVTDTTMTVPGGFYRGSFAIILNRNQWNRISEQDREAIMNVSGERLSRLFGYMMDYSDQRGYEFADAQGHVTHALDDEDMARLREITEDLPTIWAEAVQRKGVDGKAALAFFHQQLTALGDSPSIAPDTIHTGND